MLCALPPPSCLQLRSGLIGGWAIFRPMVETTAPILLPTPETKSLQRASPSMVFRFLVNGRRSIAILSSRSLVGLTTSSLQSGTMSHSQVQLPASSCKRSPDQESRNHEPGKFVYPLVDQRQFTLDRIAS